MLHSFLLASIVGATSASSPPQSEDPVVAPEVVASADAAVSDVAFVLVGEWDLDAEALRVVLAASLADLAIEVGVTTRPLQNVFVQFDWARKLAAEQPGRAVFWLVRRDADTIQLFVLPPGTELGYVRDIPFAEGGEDLAESLAVIVRGAAESLQVGPPRGMRSLEPEPEPELEPEPEPEIAPEPEPGPPPSRSGPRLRVGLGYLGATLASNARWQSGAGLDVGIRFPSGVGAAITVGWMSGPARDESTHLQLHRVPLGVVVGYAFDPTRRVTGRIMATGVAEVMWWRPAATSLRTGSDVRLGAGVRGDLVVRLYRGLGLVVGASALGWLRNVRVDVEESGVRRVLLHPSRFGGEARVGMQYEF